MLEPIYYSLFGVDTDSIMCKSGIGRCTMPVFYTRQNIYYITNFNLADRGPLFLVITEAIGYDQDLVARMRMPIVTCARFKPDIGYVAICVFI